MFEKSQERITKESIKHIIETSNRDRNTKEITKSLINESNSLQDVAIALVLGSMLWKNVWDFDLPFELVKT